MAQHPETSYADDQKYTKAAIDAMGGPVVLVGHSYGGSIITEAGNIQTLRRLSILPHLRSMKVRAVRRSNRLCRKPPRHSSGQQRQLVDRTGAFRGRLRGGHSAGSVSDFMAISQVPISTDAFTHKVTKPAWKTKPTLVHGGHRRPVDQSGAGTHDGKARRCQDGRSECPAMWPTCLIRKKRPSSSRKLRPPHRPVVEAATRRVSGPILPHAARAR